MASNEMRRADRLNEYWDRLAGGAVAWPRDLDPGLAATLRRLGLEGAPAPDAAFAARLRQELMQQRPTAATGQARALPRRPRVPWRAGRWWPLAGLAAAALLLLLVVQGNRDGKGGWPSLRRALAPAAIAPTAQPGSTVAPGQPPQLLGAAPMPNWLQTGQLTATDQGVTLACLRAIVHEPRFIVLFVAVAGPADAGAPPEPADLKVVDQTGRAYAAQVAWLDSAGAVSLGAVTITGVDPAAAVLRLQVSEMRSGGDAGSSLRGSWEVQPMQRYQPGAPLNPDRLEEMDLLACFRAGGVAVANNCFAPCDQAGAPNPAPEPPPVPGAATPAPLEGQVPTEAPLATLLPAPTAAPPLVPPPTEAPAEWPVATVTPVLPQCDFTDWRNGVFGVTLAMNAPEPHLVRVLIERETGLVRRASEAEFQQAISRAYP